MEHTSTIERKEVLICATVRTNLKKNIQLNERSQTYEANMHHLYECPGETNLKTESRLAFGYLGLGQEMGGVQTGKGLFLALKLWSWLYKTVNILTTVELHFFFLMKRWVFCCCPKPAYDSSDLPTSASQVVGIKHTAPHLAEPHALEWVDCVAYESHLNKAF